MRFTRQVIPQLPHPDRLRYGHYAFMQREVERRERLLQVKRLAELELAQAVIPTRQRHGQRRAVVSAPRRRSPLAAAVAVSGLLIAAVIVLASLLNH